VIILGLEEKRERFFKKDVDIRVFYGRICLWELPEANFRKDFKMVNAKFILTSDKSVFDIDAEYKVMSVKYEDNDHYAVVSEDYVYIYYKEDDIEFEDTMNQEELDFYNNVLEEKIKAEYESMQENLDWEETKKSLSASSLNRI
jgi:hypothetical protein